jgi:uncharacterized protein (DUF305 family)
VPHAFPLRTHATRRLLTAALTVATASALAGCGSDSDGYGDADVAYAGDVTTHHAQTLQVLDLSLGRQSLDPELGALADETRKQLFAEVEVTQKWLKRNGEKVPKTALEHSHSDQPSYDTSIPGVLPEDRLHQLEKAGDREFQAAWLEALITQEEGAVELAETAVEDAENAEIVEAAESDLEHHRKQLERLREIAGG